MRRDDGENGSVGVDRANRSFVSIRNISERLLLMLRLRNPSNASEAVASPAIVKFLDRVNIIFPGVVRNID